MRLLNLSDIHFREPDCLRPDTDPDVPFRTRLTHDLLTLCRAGGPVDAILVGGDIAYKGHPDEYKVAKQWLLALASDCGCPPDRIYVVPGNHDVDRNICARSQSVSNAQTIIAQAARETRERTLRTQLRDPETGRALFVPLEAYNGFAAEFGCNVYADQPFWRYDLELGGGVTLRMFGLTSTLISGLGERDIKAGRLYLSPLQTVLNPEPEVLNLVICHHPPSWFLDEDEVDDAVNNRAAIQLFGHKHRQRCARTPEYIRFSSGAVNPDRNEPDWKPGYNLIDLTTVGTGPDRVVEVRAYVRYLQNAPEMFTALKPNQQEDVWCHRLPVPEYEPMGPRPAVLVSNAIAPVTAPTESAISAPAAPAPAAPTAETAMSNPNTKNLVFRFWSLSVSQKREIAFKLNLITEEDLNVPEPERYARALKLAAQRGQLEELAREIEQMERLG